MGFQLNVLIDDAGNAVLCDFGLSHIKADMTSRTANTAGSSRVDLAGSHNWMAPERLLGGLPRKPSDIYALGMTTYEVTVFVVFIGLSTDGMVPTRFL